MRKIIACEFMTLDGVIQNEENDGDCPHGMSFSPSADEVVRQGRRPAAAGPVLPGRKRKPSATPPAATEGDFAGSCRVRAGGEWRKWKRVQFPLKGVQGASLGSPRPADGPGGVLASQWDGTTLARGLAMEGI